MKARLPLLFLLLAGLLLSTAAFASDADPDTTYASANPVPGWRRDYFTSSVSNEFGVAIARAADGDYVLAGRLPGSGATPAIGLIKLHPNGSLASAFGTGGRRTRDAGFSDIVDMIVDTQGRIVVIGPIAGALGQADFGVARFLANGADDTSFGSNGIAAIPFDLDAAHGRADDVPAGVIALPDGGLVVVGKIDNLVGGTTCGGVVQLLANGAPDPNATSTFGNALPGRSRVYNSSSYNSFLLRATRLPNGDLLFLGQSDTSQAGNTDWMLGIRQGAITSVNTLAIDLGSNNADYPGDMALMADGRVLIAGSSNSSAGLRGVVARLQADSIDLDTSFGSQGIFASAGNIEFRGIAVRSDGSSVAAGIANYTTGLVARITATGTIDTSFDGVFGLRTYNAPNTNGTNSFRTEFRRVLVDAGRAVIVGSAPDSASAETDRDFITLRLGSDLIFSNRFE